MFEEEEEEEESELALDRGYEDFFSITSPELAGCCP